jgi:hypothetical protein
MSVRQVGRAADQRCPALGAQLVSERGDVGLDGTHRNSELPGDLGVAQPALDR